MSIFLERPSIWNMLNYAEQCKYKNIKHMHRRYSKAVGVQTIMLKHPIKHNKKRTAIKPIYCINVHKNNLTTQTNDDRQTDRQTDTHTHKYTKTHTHDKHNTVKLCSRLSCSYCCTRLKTPVLMSTQCHSDIYTAKLPILCVPVFCVLYKHDALTFFTGGLGTQLSWTEWVLADMYHVSRLFGVYLLFFVGLISYKLCLGCLLLKLKWKLI